jgi:uncharacterized protein with ACT and thioredoxin-like domain
MVNDSAMPSEADYQNSTSRESGEGTYGLKVIKTGTMSLEVNSIEDALDNVKTKIREMNGEITYIHHYSGDSSNYANLTIKIPSENYEELLSELGKIGEETNSSTNTTDVTEEYIDLQARLNMLEDKRDAYTNLLDKAETVEDILKVERELERVVYEIESIIGRMNYIDNQVAMSTLDLRLREKAVTEFHGVNFFDKIAFAIKDGFNSMLNFSVNFLTVVVWLIPFIPFILILYFIIKKISSLFRRRKDKKNQNTN